jgi:hypothetical protein
MQISRARLWPPGQPPMKTLGWAAVIGLVAIAMLAPASPALSNDTPGNNGTVKIHEDDTENDPGEVRNEPHVCTFHLHFYFSDPEQAGTWEIQEWSPGDKGTVVLSGTYDTMGDGEDRQPEQGVYTLDPGHYKLFWDGDLDTLKHDKMKVFWVDCETTTTTTETTTTTPTTTETTTTTTTPTTTETSSVSGTTTTTETPTTTESTTTTETPTTSETSSVSGTTTGTETSSTSETTTTESPTTTESTTTTETPTTSETSSVSGTTTESTTTTETPTTSETSSVSGTTTESTTTTETPTTTTESTTTTETPTTTTSFSQTVSGTTTSSSSFSQTVSGTTTSAGPTQPNTSVQDQAPPAGGGIASLLIAAFAFLVGSILVLAPARRKNRE